MKLNLKKLSPDKRKKLYKALEEDADIVKAWLRGEYKDTDKAMEALHRINWFNLVTL